jgi:hypothetical protein
MKWAIPFSSPSAMAHLIGEGWITKRACRSGMINGKAAIETPPYYSQRCQDCLRIEQGGKYNARALERAMI